MTFVRFYCCHWRFSAPAVAPLKDRIVSAESNILNLENQPILILFSVIKWTSVVYDAIWRESRLIRRCQREKKSQLIYKERFYCVISLYTCRSEKLNKISSFRSFFQTEKILKQADVSFEENQMPPFIKNPQSEKEFKITSLGVKESNQTCFSYLHEHSND